MFSFEVLVHKDKQVLSILTERETAKYALVDTEAHPFVVPGRIACVSGPDIVSDDLHAIVDAHPSRVFSGPSTACIFPKIGADKGVGVAANLSKRHPRRLTLTEEPKLKINFFILFLPFYWSPTTRFVGTQPRN